MERDPPQGAELARGARGRRVSEASRWAQTLMHALAAAGVRELIVSPGSRSTSLVLAAAGVETLRLHSVIDERAAAFFALGQARVTGRPTALLCTSGTAPAHYYPAVIEAALASVPLLVLSADRPPELQASTAPQTIDQTRLFGTYTRAFFDLGLPNDEPLAHAAVRRKAAQAVARTMGPMPGPVHINVPARKPFEPDARSSAMPGPTPEVLRPAANVDAAAFDPIVDRLQSALRPVIVAGPSRLATAGDRQALADVAHRCDAAVYAEATSQLRFGLSQPGEALGALLGSRAFTDRFEPDLVVQLGAPVVSGAWHRWRAARPDVPMISIAQHEWPDPSQGTDTWVVADPSAVLRALQARLPAGRARRPWRDKVSTWDRRAWETIDRVLPADSEGEAVRIVRHELPEDSLLMLGNSLSVRHFDSFCASGGRPVGVVHQRGASGIDGLVAGAAGAASVGDCPVTLVLGDVSLAHDAAALALAQSVSTPLLIIVLDNGGGRIFEFLPAGRTLGQQPVFEHFVTSPRVDAQTLATAFGLCHVRVEGTGELAAALGSAYRVGTTTVVQVKLPDHGARAVADAVEAALDAELGRRGV